MYSRPLKIADYLYEIDYNDYRQDTNFETIHDAEAFGCSSVRNGDFYGRNFDYIYNDTPEFIVRMSATATRHASIGVATHFGLRESKVYEYGKQLELIPNLTLDGINDCGVICSHNVVAIEQGNVITGTNPNGEDLHMLFIPRFVLDNADTALEGVELIKSRNIFGNLANKDYLHVMIADQNETYIVEFYNNEVIVQKKTGNEQIMTNYYLNLQTMQNKALGVERYNILKENYSLGSTFEGMQQLMQKVKYAYAYDVDQENLWYSESLTQEEINSGINKEEIIEQMYPLCYAYWKARGTNNRTPNPAFWQTVHNSTYDMQNKKLSVFVQEDYEKCYDFYL